MKLLEVFCIKLSMTDMLHAIESVS